MSILSAIGRYLGPLALLSAFFWIAVSLCHFATGSPYLCYGGIFRQYLSANYGAYSWEGICIWLGSLALLAFLPNLSGQTSKSRAFLAAGLTALLALFSFIWFIVVIAQHSQYKSGIQELRKWEAQKEANKNLGLQVPESPPTDLIKGLDLAAIDGGHSSQLLECESSKVKKDGYLEALNVYDKAAHWPSFLASVCFAAAAAGFVLAGVTARAADKVEETESAGAKK